MENNRIYAKNPVPCFKVRGRPAAGQQPRLEIADNRPSAAAQRRLAGNIPVQRVTQINYTTQELTIAGQKCVTGKNMIAYLDPTDPVKGTGTSGRQKNIMDLLPGYLRGHLLNHDLGGLGIACNLFPITNSENGLHKNRAENQVKNSLGVGHDVYYKVEAQNNTTNYATAADFIKEKPGFQWGASNTAFPTALDHTPLNGLVGHNINSNPWKHKRDGLPNILKIQNTLTKTGIDGSIYTHTDLTHAHKNLNNGY